MQPLLCIPDWTGPSQSKELAGVWFSRRYSFYSIPLPHPLPEPPRILSVGGCVSLCPSGQEASGSHSTVTHGLMGKENILNLSYPSETVTCGFQKHEFPEEGEGK